MERLIFTIKVCKRLKGILLAVFSFLLICGCAGNSFAQYKGAAVKKERLLQALRSKQFQTREIVTIINNNGVDFPLTAEIRRSLIAAGARPEVIRAISGNSRTTSKSDNSARLEINSSNRRKKIVKSSYDDLLSQANYTYKEQKNPQNAIRILEVASKSKPQNPEAYQMLGFIQLYGLNNFTQAEKSMRESVTNGGSAVFRVFHDDNGKFSKTCTGSLYISQDTLRFESDDNAHTFEISTLTIDKVKLDKVSTKLWKNRSIFKIYLKISTEDAKFRFAPLTGNLEETKMVERFIASANSLKSPNGSAVVTAH